MIVSFIVLINAFLVTGRLFLCMPREMAVGWFVSAERGLSDSSWSSFKLRGLGSPVISKRGFGVGELLLFHLLSRTF